MNDLNFLYFFFKVWCWAPYKINSTVFYVSDFQVRYYGLAYLLAVLFFYFLLSIKCVKNGYLSVYTRHVDNLIIAGTVGLFIGGRLGYVLFYGFEYYHQFPLEVFLPMKNRIFIGYSGMSYHGGFFGGLVSVFFYTKYEKLVFLELSDFAIPFVPIGCLFGRIGNFTNGELYGRVTNFFLGMYFPKDCKILLRHPSQLYEAFLEGLVLFILLQVIQDKTWFKGKLLFVYLISYGLLRLIIECYREPDFQIGLIIYFFSLGQLLSIIMVVFGFVLFFFRFKN